jgi:hypothetical protein
MKAAAEMPSFKNQADKLMVAGHYAKSQALLELELERISAGWQPRKDSTRFLKIAFWDQEEFLAYSSHQRERLAGIRRGVRPGRATQPTRLRRCQTRSLV